jgi:catechol 2,3-dioxygenase-like lactoylglutathione lyase family enzyme
MRHRSVVVSLPIADRRASLAFYRDGLGFGLVDRRVFLSADCSRGFGGITGDNAVVPNGCSQ